MTASKWRERVEEKALRGRLWAAFGMEQFVRIMWERFSCSVGGRGKMKGKLEQTATGRRRRRTKNCLNLSRTAVTCVVKGNCCVGHTKRGSQEIGKNYLEVYLEDDVLRLWASVKVRECYNEVDSEDEGRTGIAQEILRQRMDFLRSHTK